MKWPWARDENEGEKNVPADPDREERRAAQRQKEELMVRVVALGIEADTIVRR